MLNNKKVVFDNCLNDAAGFENGTETIMTKNSQIRLKVCLFELNWDKFEVQGS